MGDSWAVSLALTNSSVCSPFRSPHSPQTRFENNGFTYAKGDFKFTTGKNTCKNHFLHCLDNVIQRNLILTYEYEVIFNINTKIEIDRCGPTPMPTPTETNKKNVKLDSIYFTKTNLKRKK